MATLSLYFPDSEAIALKKAAESKGISVSELVREACKLHVEPKKQQLTQLERDVRFIRAGLEDTWKDRFPAVLEKALKASGERKYEDYFL